MQRSIQITNNRCRNCGGNYPHDNECPAKGKQCRACGRQNRFAKQCRSKPKDTYMKRPQSRVNWQPKKVHNITETAPDEEKAHDAYVFAVDAKETSELPQTHIKLNGNRMLVLIDSGATANCISEVNFQKLKPRPQLSPTKTFQTGSESWIPSAGASSRQQVSCHLEANITRCIYGQKGFEDHTFEEMWGLYSQYHALKNHPKDFTPEQREVVLKAHSSTPRWLNTPVTHITSFQMKRFRKFIRDKEQTCS
ncbi:uncharacterized protein LOC117818348 isoform X2 [Notolabrus celidotus]|uniref:uncharacterized protein LOC117818348 isoform X2 n=1 Tax=Notolabrus celidotus TaxID=1203425 RepID=UPI0014904612|nr:uncharacterized protein LOC117818348 isoform X2 [Notolabrus celidotus]